MVADENFRALLVHLYDQRRLRELDTGGVSHPGTRMRAIDHAHSGEGCDKKRPPAYRFLRSAICLHSSREPLLSFAGPSNSSASFRRTMRLRKPVS